MTPQPLRDHAAAEARLRRLRRRFASSSGRRRGLRLSEWLVIAVMAAAAIAYGRGDLELGVPRSQARTPAPQAVYYPNCAAARAAGQAPMPRAHPGYRPPLDADNDGWACEPVRRQ